MSVALISRNQRSNSTEVGIGSSPDGVDIETGTQREEEFRLGRIAFLTGGTVGQGHGVFRPD